MTTTYSKIHLALAKHLKINPEWLSDQTYGTEKDQVFHFVYSEKQDCDEGEVQTFAHLFDVWEVDDQDGEARFFMLVPSAMMPIEKKSKTWTYKRQNTYAKTKICVFL